MIQTFGLVWQPPGGARLCFPDAAVPQGGTLLLRGSSGSGKRTWLSLAAGLLTPSAGRVVVAGQSVADLAPIARGAWRTRNIGFLPQRRLLSEALSVAGNLARVYCAAGLPVDEVAVARTLDALGVARLAWRRPACCCCGRRSSWPTPPASLDDAAGAAALRLLSARTGGRRHPGDRHARRAGGAGHGLAHRPVLCRRTRYGRRWPRA